MAGLYIHIPFCLKKCPYCDFYSVPYEESLVNEYINCLLNEASLSQVVEPIETIYFGGGTPSLLKPYQIETIIRRISSIYSLATSIEVSLEANPETINRKTLRDFLSCGVNRLSIGIQSLQDHELKAIGRIHDSERALSALAEAREVFENISVDIMYGLPGQSTETLGVTLNKLLQFEPPHISAYELTIHEATEFFHLRNSSLLELPDELTTEEMYFFILQNLKDRGYEHYEVSNYALKGYQCRHNMNYWLMGHYIGLGPSAHSFYCNKRWENLPDLKKYIQKIKRGIRPVSSLRTLTPKDIKIESLMLKLRTSAGVALEDISCSPEKIKDFQKEGLVDIVNERLKLTDRGMLLSNRIIVELLDDL